ncbi:MAG: A24 family peptidase [Alphaproteobacteria bacterium]|nr:A24 family peptidase [Alphaproteobacteria bacterium]
MALPASKATTNGLFWWETRWLDREDIFPTLLPPSFLILSTIICTILIALLSWQSFSAYWFLFLILGRLAALDLHYRVLPNIYTIPLFLTGLVVAYKREFFIQGMASFAFTTALLLILILMMRILGKKNVFLGGGDIKLMLAMSVWLSPTLIPWSFWLAGFLMLPFAFYKPYKHHDIPFGPALITSFTLFLFHQEYLENLIYQLFFSIH